EFQDRPRVEPFHLQTRTSWPAAGAPQRAGSLPACARHLAEIHPPSALLTAGLFPSRACTVTDLLVPERRMVDRRAGHSRLFSGILGNTLPGWRPTVEITTRGGIRGAPLFGVIR